MPNTGTRPAGPLAGVKVVEFAGLAPVTVAGMMLSDLGAEVVRIDRRDHAADRADNPLRRGRRSVAIDLKRPDGRRVAEMLIARADLLIEAYRPGVMERLALGPDRALELNPRLVYGRLTGWGQSGPLAPTAGHDITYLAVTGALYPMGPADGPPTPPLNYVADMGGGALFLIVGLLAALHERTARGRGQVVDAAMVDGVTVLMATLLRSQAEGVWSDRRGENIPDGGAPFYRTYTCADGKFIAVGAIEAAFYAQFVEGLGFNLEDLPPQLDRAQWQRVSAMFAGRIRTRTRAEWESVFAGTDACVAPVLSPTEAPQHPHMAARAAFTQLCGHWQAAPAPRLDRTPPTVAGPAPYPGADTIEILNSLGLSGSTIDDLIDRAAVFVEHRR